MGSQVRLTQQSLRILRAFLDAMTEDARSELAGADIMNATNLFSGTVYPILLRFEHAGLLESHWESQEPEALGRPRRRYYRLTPAGIDTAKKALDDLTPAAVRQLKPAFTA